MADSKPINIRVNAKLLDNFRRLCESQGLSYTEVIKCMMADYVSGKRQIFKKGPVK